MHTHLTQLLALLLLAPLAGCADEGAALEPVDTTACRVVAINSDYVSSSVSLLTSEGELCADSVLHSGSAPPGLVTALSGDVVPGRAPHPEGLITLIDRYPNAVLTLLDPATQAVTAQLSVATGFASNPQDVVHLSADRAWVSRAETNPTPGAEPFDEGGDLLLVDIAAGRIHDRIDLDPFAPVVSGQRTLPRPGPMALAQGLLWVSLLNLSGDFMEGGEAVVLGVDPESGRVLEEVRLPGVKNCAGLAADPDGDGLWLTCSGVFAEGARAQLDHSGVVWIALSAGQPGEVEQITAASLAGRPVGFSVAPVGAGVAFVVVVSDVEGRQPDELWRVERGAGGARVALSDASEGYQLGSPLLTDAGVLLVPDATATAPVVLRFDLTDPASPTPLPTVDANPGLRLPTRLLARFR